MIQVINSYLVFTINHYYTYNTINHKDLKFMDLKNMASAIRLDGLELVQFITIIDLKLHR